MTAGCSAAKHSAANTSQALPEAFAKGQRLRAVGSLAPCRSVEAFASATAAGSSAAKHLASSGRNVHPKVYGLQVLAEAFARGRWPQAVGALASEECEKHWQHWQKEKFELAKQCLRKTFGHGQCLHAGLQCTALQRLVDTTRGQRLQAARQHTPCKPWLKSARQGHVCRLV